MLRVPAASSAASYAASASLAVSLSVSLALLAKPRFVSKSSQSNELRPQRSPSLTLHRSNDRTYGKLRQWLHPRHVARGHALLRSSRRPLNLPNLIGSGLSVCIAA